MARVKRLEITGQLDGKDIAILGPGMHRDGTAAAGTTGLYLQCTSGANGVRRSWIFRFMSVNGREKQLGLGSLENVSVQEARKLAREYRELRNGGTDPVGRREKLKTERAQEQQSKIEGTTFDQCAEKYIEIHRDGWRNAKHANQWQSTLKAYASPVFGSLPVRTVTRAHVLEALEKLWRAKPETARRVRGRIEAVLEFAIVREYREGPNPARMGREETKHALGKQKRVVKHHAALPYRQLGAFMRDLREREGTAARALEFTILTAARTSEALSAEWSEIDLDARIWTVPAAKMKAGREHRVPLSDAAVDVLKQMEAIRQNRHVFPSPTDRCPTLSNMAMATVLRRMSRGDITVHGFRSTFRDWVAELTSYPREVAEAALAHAVENEVEAAYRRGDLFEKRRRLMDEWAQFCADAKIGADVVPIRAGAA